jgi:hypothetical protein
LAWTAAAARLLELLLYLQQQTPGRALALPLLALG